MFRLALQLGMTVNQLERDLGNRELNEWIAFSKLEPFGSEIQSWRSGVIAATVYNSNATKGNALKPKDFMPTSETKPKRTFTAEIARSFFGNTQQVRD